MGTSRGPPIERDRVKSAAEVTGFHVAMGCMKGSRFISENALLGEDQGQHQDEEGGLGGLGIADDRPNDELTPRRDSHLRA